MKTDEQKYEIPDGVAKQVMVMANVEEHHLVLYPCAGDGDLLKHMPVLGNVMVVESLLSFFVGLTEKYPEANFLNQDILNIEPNEESLFDRVVMFPPFDQQQEAKQIIKAWDFLKPKGILVAIVSDKTLSSLSSDCVALYTLRSLHEVDVLDMVFNTSGTMLKSKIIKLIKPSR